MNKMNLYLLEQTKFREYNTFDSAVVVASSEQEAILLHPVGDRKWKDNHWQYTTGRFLRDDYAGLSWPNPEHVKATLIGKAEENLKEGVVCSSFNAG